MKRSPLVKICARYAGVAGVLTFVLLLILFYTGHHPMLVAPFLDFRILLFGIFIVFALKEFRDYYQQGVLYFWQGLLGSLFMVLVSSAIASAGFWIFGAFEPTFVGSYVEQMTAYLKTFPKEDIERIGKDIYERNLEQLPATNISKLVITYFFQGIAIGFFVSIILSVIMRRQPKTN
jgi:uncharacterized membrane-anchored protein YitT (DUF2179 family)